jgi:nucleolin
VATAEDSDDSEDSSDESDDSEEETAAPKKALKQSETNDNDSDTSLSSDSSDSDSEEEAPSDDAKVNKKRKADDSVEAVVKKSKTVNGSADAAPSGNQIKNLFIGNLSWNIDEEWLTREFEEFGEITRVNIVTDRDSGRSKG